MSAENIRKEFPILNQKNRNKKLIYFDSAATSLKPIAVIEKEMEFYKEYGASIHRSVYELGEKATNAFENTRKNVAKFIGSSSAESIIFTKSATESINLVADAWGFKNLKKNDVILLTDMEHHSNIVPWQIISEKTGAKIQYVKSTPNGTLNLDDYENMLNKNVKIVSVTHASNVLGTINPIKDIVKKAHDYGALVMVDGCQSTPHIRIDVKELDCDFFAFSGHKMFGPTGVGVLYGKEKLLNELPVYQGGGEMIKEVRLDKTTFADLPYKFEAGTPNIAGIIAFKNAMDFILEIGLDTIASYENTLLEYATVELKKIEGVKLFGVSNYKSAIISFNIEDVHPYDVGVLLDKMGIAIRTGHHCTQPIMERFNIPGTVRISLAVYNTIEEIDICIRAIKKAKLMLS